MKERIPCLRLNVITRSRCNGVDDAGMLYAAVAADGRALESIDAHVFLSEL